MIYFDEDGQPIQHAGWIPGISARQSVLRRVLPFILQVVLPANHRGTAPPPGHAIPALQQSHESCRQCSPDDCERTQLPKLCVDRGQRLLLSLAPSPLGRFAVHECHTHRSRSRSQVTFGVPGNVPPIHAADRRKPYPLSGRYSLTGREHAGIQKRRSPVRHGT